MSEIKDHPAFPVVAHHEVYSTGMSLRDYFAAAALTGMGNWTGGHSIGLKSAARNKAALAYEIADAMLAARQDSTQ